MKVGLITTLDTNIGDDFIREGLLGVLRHVLRGRAVDFVPVNKHEPYTVYPQWHPVHYRDTFKRIPVADFRIDRFFDEILPRIGLSRFDGCDLIVQCGAPVLWPRCHTNEWAKPLWNDIIGRLYDKIPVLNLAAGSCYPWERPQEYLDQDKDAEYIRTILGYCRVTTVRDRLAQEVCQWVGSDVPLIPCSAFLAARGRVAPLEDSGYLLINYMAGGGHFSWEQGLDAEEWARVVSGLVERLQARHNLAFLCHNQQEVDLARELAPGLPCFLPETPSDYFDLAMQAKFALCNRMHASVGMAGLGIPSIAVCTDSRLLMVAELGLQYEYVKELALEGVEADIEEGLKMRHVEQQRLLDLQGRTWDQYVEIVENALGS